MSEPKLTPVQELNALKEQFQSLTTEHNSAKAEAARVPALLAEVTKVKTDLATELSAHSDTKLELAKLKGEFGATKAELEAVKTDFENKVAKAADAKAATIAASQGIPPVAAPVASGSKIKEDVKPVAKKGEYIQNFAAGFRADLIKSGLMTAEGKLSY